jgi:hypothetical protein
MPIPAKQIRVRGTPTAGSKKRNTTGKVPKRIIMGPKKDKKGFYDFVSYLQKKKVLKDTSLLKQISEETHEREKDALNRYRATNNSQLIKNFESVTMDNYKQVILACDIIHDNGKNSEGARKAIGYEKAVEFVNSFFFPKKIPTFKKEEDVRSIIRALLSKDKAINKLRVENSQILIHRTATKEYFFPGQKFLTDKFIVNDNVSSMPDEIEKQICVIPAKLIDQSTLGLRGFFVEEHYKKNIEIILSQYGFPEDYTAIIFPKWNTDQKRGSAKVEIRTKENEIIFEREKVYSVEEVTTLFFKQKQNLKDKIFIGGILSKALGDLSLVHSIKELNKTENKYILFNSDILNDTNAFAHDVPTVFAATSYLLGKGTKDEENVLLKGLQSELNNKKISQSDLEHMPKSVSVHYYIYTPSPSLIPYEWQIYKPWTWPIWAKPVPPETTAQIVRMRRRTRKRGLIQLGGADEENELFNVAIAVADTFGNKAKSRKNVVINQIIDAYTKLRNELLKISSSDGKNYQIIFDQDILDKNYSNLSSNCGFLAEKEIHTLLQDIVEHFERIRLPTNEAELAGLESEAHRFMPNIDTIFLEKRGEKSYIYPSVILVNIKPSDGFILRENYESQVVNEHKFIAIEFDDLLTREFGNESRLFSYSNDNYHLFLESFEQRYYSHLQGLDIKTVNPILMSMKENNITNDQEIDIKTVNPILTSMKKNNITNDQEIDFLQERCGTLMLFVNYYSTEIEDHLDIIQLLHLCFLFASYSDTLWVLDDKLALKLAEEAANFMRFKYIIKNSFAELYKRPGGYSQSEEPSYELLILHEFSNYVNYENNLKYFNPKTETIEDSIDDTVAKSYFARNQLAQERLEAERQRQVALAIALANSLEGGL